MNCSKTQKYMQNTAKYLFLNDRIPDKSIFNSIKHCNARETLTSDGWPRTFLPSHDKCPSCNIILSPVTKKKRKSNDDHSLLISMEHVIEVDIFTKQCKLCFLILKPDTLNLGLLNIGDMTLVTVDIFFSLQNSIRFVRFIAIVLSLIYLLQSRRGLPPQTAASSIVADILDRTTYFSDVNG